MPSDIYEDGKRAFSIGCSKSKNPYQYYDDDNFDDWYWGWYNKMQESGKALFAKEIRKYISQSTEYPSETIDNIVGLILFNQFGSIHLGYHLHIRWENESGLWDIKIEDNRS